MELESYIQQAHTHLYKNCLYTLNQAKSPTSSQWYAHTEYILIQVICTSSPSNTLSPNLLSYLFNSLGSLCMTLAYIVQVESDQLNTYFVLQHPNQVPLALDLFIQSLEDFIPGIQIKRIENSSLIIPQLFYLFAPRATLTACSLIPNSTTSNTLLEQLVSLMPQDSYTFMLLAEAIPPLCYQELRKCLSKLHLNLSGFREITRATSTSTTYSDSSTRSKTCTQNESSSLSQSNTHSDTESSSKTHSNSLALSNKLTDKTSFNNTFTDTCSNSQNRTLTDVANNTSSNQNSASDADNHVKTCTTVESSSTTSRSLNLEVVHLMEQIELLLKRYDITQNLTMFNFCTYFFSPYPSTCLRASFNYAGLGANDTFPLSNSFVNTWQKSSPHFESVANYLKCFHHPIFYDSSGCDYITPAFPVTSLEYATLTNFCLSP